MKLKTQNQKLNWIKSLLTFFIIKMTVKELIKQLKMVQKNHEGKEIQVKIGTIEKGEVKEKDLILQNIVESNYDGKTTIILTNY